MLFRRSCIGCRRPAGLGRHRAGSSSLCPSCAAELTGRSPIALGAPPDGVDIVMALHRYGPPVRSLVLAAKNGGQRALLVRWGGAMAAVVADGALGTEGFDLVTWVPASRARVRGRGYDQGRVLARALAADSGIAARRLLVRRPGPSRIGADRVDRLVGPDLRCPVVAPPRVLLVDDVTTTGASLTAAARALRRSGARSVAGLVIAAVGVDRDLRHETVTPR